MTSTHQKTDGMTYAPRAAKPQPVVKPGDFRFAAAYFDHGHIHGQIAGLREAGGQLTLIYDPDAARLQKLREQFIWWPVQPSRATVARLVAKSCRQVKTTLPTSAPLRR